MDIDRSDLIVIVSSIVAGAIAISTLTFDKSLVAIVTAAGAVLTAILGYLKARRAEANARKTALDVADITARTAIDTNAKTVLVQSITAERAKWRSDLREVVTELTALLRASARNEEVGWRKVDALASGIRLRLNPAGRGPAPSGSDGHEKDRKIHDDLDALELAGTDGKAQHGDIAERLERHMAEILKQEWDVSKAEAVTGKLKTS